MLTLDDFNKQVLRPMILKDIKAGRLDSAIFSLDCADIINDDPELLAATVERAKELADKEYK
jgi:hypothetical protein